MDLCDTNLWSVFDRVTNFGNQNKCWEWEGACIEGYGIVVINKNRWLVHRLAYTLLVGPIPKDKPLICHHCDNPPCCNPIHLFPGTNADNLADMRLKGRSKMPPPMYGDNNPLRLHPERAARGDANGSRLHPECLKRGESHPTSKLKDRDVIKIRQMASEMSQRKIAALFGVSRGTIQFIINRHNWKHVG